MRHLTKSHKHISNVLIVLEFHQTLLGKQTNSNKSQKKLKIDPTLGCHILDVFMPYYSIISIAF
jgi:hypothetical protein